MPYIDGQDNNETIRLYYEVHGEGHPLVFVAGFGADHLVWQSVVDELSKRYQVILFDNRGAGKSDVPQGPYTIEQMAHDLFSLCHALSIEKASFIGNSMGGYILQAFALKFPEYIEHLIISNSTIKTNLRFNLYLQAQYELIKSLAPTQSLIKAGLAWCYSSHFLKQPGRVKELIDNSLLNPNPFTLEGYAAQIEALKSFNSSGKLQSIKAKTLVIGSNEDIIFDEPSIKFLAEQIPNACYYSFKNVGHLPFIEKPEQFINLVEHFIDDN